MKRSTDKNMMLLGWLRNNSRLPLTKISKKTSIPISTLFDKLKEQEEEYVFKYTTLIDFSKLGYHTKAHILLKAPSHLKKELEHHLACNENVNSVYKVTDKFHYLVEGVFKHIAEYDSFIESLEQRFPPLEHASHFITKDLKREMFLCEKSQPYGLQRAS